MRFGMVVGRARRQLRLERHGIALPRLHPLRNRVAECVAEVPLI